MDHPCPHMDWARVREPAAAACAQCLDAGKTWVQLRMCLTCGHVGCCDLSEGRHASSHFRVTGHPLMRSLEPGENWVWCHVDRIAFLPDAFDADPFAARP